MAPFGVETTTPTSSYRSGNNNNNNFASSEFEVDYDRNITKLYEAITNCDWELAIQAAKENPQEAETWVVRRYEESEEIMWRFLPIHSACARQPPSTVISTLLKAFPDGARSVDDQGMYALHYACGNQASREVIRLLLVANPQAAKMTDPRGMLPIHYLACWGPSTVSIIDMVLVAHRTIGNAKDSEGNTPLDLAMEGEYPERDQVVAALKRWLDTSPSTTRDIEIPSLTSDEGSTAATATTTVTRSTTPRPSTPTSSSMAMTRMRQEISKLKTDLAKRDQEWEVKVAESVSSLKATCYDLEKKVSSATKIADGAQSKIAELEGLLDQKESDLATMEVRVKELKTRHTEMELERDDLRQTLAEVSDQRDVYKRKSDTMSTQLESLSNSLFNMMEGQNELMKTVQNKEAQMAEASTVRRSKIQSLLEMEDEFLTDILDKTAEDTMSVTHSIRRQCEEMDAISTVIANVRQN